MQISQPARRAHRGTGIPRNPVETAQVQALFEVLWEVLGGDKFKEYRRVPMDGDPKNVFTKKNKDP